MSVRKKTFRVSGNRNVWPLKRRALRPSRYKHVCTFKLFISFEMSQERKTFGSIHAKTTNRDRRQVTDFVKNWTLGEKGWEKSICQGIFVSDEPFTRYHALKIKFS